jgi:acetyl esterase/lipase
MKVSRRFVLIVCCALVASPGAVVAQSKTATRPAPKKPAPTQADVSYGPHAHQLLDIYVPPQGRGPFPVLMWFGALWKAGKHPAPLDKFLPAGVAVVAVEMRVMEDAIKDKIDPPVSVCLLDARRALQFVRFNATKWNLDPSRIGVGGGSQGALPALYLGCEGERADPDAIDPVERVSTKVTCVGAYRSQPSIDPKQMQAWVPGVKWGAPALGYNFDESLKRRDELLPKIQAWSPDALVTKDAAPMYFENEWGLTRPDDIKAENYDVHSPRWGIGFQKLAQQRGATCYLKYLGHPSEKYADIWDFLVKELTAQPQGSGDGK